jgi:hypothetical protein
MEKTIEQRIADVYEDRREEEDGSSSAASVADLGTVIVEIANAIRTDTVLETRIALSELGFISATPRDLIALRAEQKKLESEQRQVQEIT